MMDRDGKGGEGANRRKLEETDPDAPPSVEEIAAAEALRRALDEPQRADASADFARAVSLAHGPRPIDPAEHQAIVARAIERGKPGRGSGGRLAFGSFAIAGGLAVAAAVALVLGTGLSGTASAPPASVPSVEPLAPVRSTQPLFHEPFARTGGESARIDRIALARGSDLRDNRFAAWGVK